MKIIYGNKIGENIENVLPENSSVYVIIDKNLSSYYHFFNKYEIIEVEVSEKLKTLSVAENIINILLEKGADRNAFIIGVGGGITTDLVGFVASIYKRGVKFGFVPTTLLSQVDASIGGKNGVNISSYKNIAGVINQPQWICSSAEFMNTLSRRDFVSGISEILKTFIIFDKDYYKKSIELFANEKEYILNHRQSEFTNIIQKCAEYKAAVVKRDEFERGERRLLNLGHTFGHAIEKNNQNGIMHGEAVAIGTILAARFAMTMGLTSASFVDELVEDTKKVGLPYSTDIALNVLVEAMTKDKKVNGKNINLLLPLDFGRVEDVEISTEKMEEIINGMR